MNRSLVNYILAFIIVLESILVGFLFYKLTVIPPTDGFVDIDTKYIVIPAFELDSGSNLNEYVIKSTISLDPSFYVHFVETNTVEGITTTYNNYYKVVLYFGSGNPADFSEDLHYIEWNISLHNNLKTLEYILEGDNLPDDVRNSFDLMLSSVQTFEYLKILIYNSQDTLIYTLNTYAENQN